MNKFFDTKKMVTIAVFSAIAYIITFVMQPIKISFLSFEVKDSIIMILGFIYGPISALTSIIVCALVELITFSNTGLYGFAMNVVSSASFVLTAEFIYKYKRNVKGAVIGLSVACVVMTCVMLAWNYILAPWYMKVPRDVVSDLLLPFFMPFNLAKGIVNASVTILLYKPIVTMMRSAGLVDASKSKKAYKLNLGLLAVGLFFIATGIGVLMFLNR